MARQVLFVDDSPTMRRVMEITWMGGDGLLTCVSGAAAALEHAVAHPPDVAIVDAGLVALDAPGLVGALRQRAPDAAVLLLASPRHRLDRAATEAAGADGLLDKPFATQALLRAVEGLRRRPRATGASPQRTRGLGPPPPRARATPTHGLPPAARAAPTPRREAVTSEAREIIEAVAWEVVPELAETMIRTQLEARAKA